MNRPISEAPSQLDELNRQQLIALVVEQPARLLQLEQPALEQAATIRALQEQLAKDSSNSDKPPSSDGPKKSKPGGQKGRRLEMRVMPSHVVRHPPNQCPKCV